MSLNKLPQELGSPAGPESAVIEDLPQITPVKRRSPNRVLVHEKRTPSLQDKPIPILTAPDSGSRTSPAPTKAERNFSHSLSPSRGSSLASAASNRSFSSRIDTLPRDSLGSNLDQVGQEENEYPEPPRSPSKHHRS